MNNLKNSFYAISAAILFGLSTPISKIFVKDINPFVLAGLLYLGSGVGLLAMELKNGHPLKQLLNLSTIKRMKFLGAIASGGILAPLALVYGIKYGTSFEASVLLNFEAVASTLIAWFIFKEHVDTHVWIGKAIIIIGTVLLVFQPESQFAVSFSSIWILLACILWGIDNSLTRDVEELTPSTLAGTKGFIAGITNLTIGIAVSGAPTGAISILLIMIVGFFSYGISLVFFVKSLRLIGTSRTASYFATGPFFGMLISILFLFEKPLASQWLAAAIILVGTLVLFREKHGHVHTHETLTHTHKHSHDEHHQHVHSDLLNLNETHKHDPKYEHEHEHTHEPITHTHLHFPDIHHRHTH